MTMSSVAKYNRQNSNNAQLEMGRTNIPMLQKQTSIRETRKLFRQISQNTSRVMKCVFIVSLLLNFISIPALTAVITIMFQQTCITTNPDPRTPDMMCYPCGEDGIPGVPGTQRTSNGYCCALRSDPMLQRLRDRNILPVAAASTQPVKPCPDAEKKNFSQKTVAHLLVKVSETKSKQKIFWESESSTGSAFLSGDLEIHNGMIRVKKGGIYRVKSHFSLDSVNNKGINGTVLFDHRVCKVPKNRQVHEITTLKLEKTMLLSQHYVSSDVDLNVKLWEGDSIYVSLHTYRYLYAMDIANTFDIEKID